MTVSKHNASRIRHRLILQEEVRIPDDAGGYSKNWQDVIMLWAEILPIAGSDSRLSNSGKETVVGGQIQSELSHRVLLRYRPGVMPGMRLVFENRAFNIRYVSTPEERKETLQLLVQEGVAD